MSRVDAAASMDRLPWLEDEPRSAAVPQRRAALLVSAAVAILAVGSAGAWIGLRTLGEQTQVPPRHAQATTTVRLPAPRPAVPEVRNAPEPQVRLAPVPQVRSAPTPEVRIAEPGAAPGTKRETVAAPAQEEQGPEAKPDTTAASAAASRPQARPFALPKPWPPRVVHGAAGRLVQVGAFGSIHQAKRGWWFMVRAYPAMAHLPAVVTETRNSRGVAFYRFQVGTTSQAHSEVLCQRMRRISLSCAVVGLPWKSKVER
jgi:hypothetical protein